MDGPHDLEWSRDLLNGSGKGVEAGRFDLDGDATWLGGFTHAQAAKFPRCDFHYARNLLIRGRLSHPPGERLLHVSLAESFRL